MLKAVITADLIHSSLLPGGYRAWCMEKIGEKLKALQVWAKMESEIYRGDSFQSLLHAPGSALQVALVLKTYIKGLEPTQEEMKEMGYHAWTDFQKQQVDVRISLAIGEVDNETGKIGTSNGEAFRLSGRQLDEMTGFKRSFGATSDDVYKQELETEAVLLDALLSRSTVSQCQVICFKLEGMTEMGIAEKLKINQSAVNQRASSGSWYAMEAVVKRFEKIYAHG